MGFDGRKVTAYLQEMRQKIYGMSDDFIRDYIAYCEKKVDDFPSDVNYKEAVEQLKRENKDLLK